MLTIQQLEVSAKKGKKLLKGVDITIPYGGVVGLTGASGAGKTTLIKSVMGMLDRGCGVTAGAVVLDEANLTALDDRQHRALCGTTLGYIPQNPMTAFDDRVTVGKQMAETFRLKLGDDKSSAYKRAASCLEAVNLKDTRRVLHAKPGELSGGMLQRVCVALIVGLKPRYVLADEPTAALDADNVAELLKLLKRQTAHSGILFISHDVEALTILCETVYVLDGGAVVETGDMETLLTQPRHLWTKAFSQAYSKFEKEAWTWKV